MEGHDVRESMPLKIEAAEDERFAREQGDDEEDDHPGVAATCRHQCWLVRTDRVQALPGELR